MRPDLEFQMMTGQPKNIFVAGYLEFLLAKSISGNRIILIFKRHQIDQEELLLAVQYKSETPFLYIVV